jgi:hypothetical protein
MKRICIASIALFLALFSLPDGSDAVQPPTKPISQNLAAVPVSGDASGLLEAHQFVVTYGIRPS